MNKKLVARVKSVRILKAKNSAYKFNLCGNRSSLGGADFFCPKMDTMFWKFIESQAGTTYCFWGVCVHLWFSLCSTS